MTNLEARAAIHAALGDPTRLRVVDSLRTSDRSVSGLRDDLDIAGNLLAHHLDVLEDAGVIERVVSRGDRRRRYVRLTGRVADVAVLGRPRVPTGAPLFVCTHNSARSPLAAALWQRHTGRAARSAGTRPAAAVHPQARAAARRAGLDLSAARPRAVTPRDLRAPVVVTVCDRAAEELEPRPRWWHWSIPDPAEDGSRAAFDAAVEQLDDRIRSIVA